jgi:Na+-translocating ferredoxin:NAD+ oxidoreductase RnfD subunit
MTAAAPAISGPMRFFLGLSPKWLITIFITTILIVGQISFQILKGVEVLVLCVGTALLVELVLSKFARGRVANMQSAYVSGLSMTVLTQTQQGYWWPFIVGAAIAITSKFALVYKNQHLWNPTNFAISLLVLFAPSSVSVLSEQWGNNKAPLLIVWLVGLLVASRAKILHVTLTYAAAFLLLGWLRSEITGSLYKNEIAPITGPMYQLFLFFMITDPRTTVRSKRWRIVVALIIAVVECLIRLSHHYEWHALEPLQSAPPIFALAIVGPIALAIDLYLRKEPAPAKPKLAAA